MLSDLISELKTECSEQINLSGSVKKLPFSTTCEEFVVASDYESKVLGKDKGRYVMLDFKYFLSRDDLFKTYLKQFKSVLKEYFAGVDKSDEILVVGLGNRHISADSLGVEVVKNLVITRLFDENLPKVCAISPSVLGLTGIETADIIEAVVEKIKPSYVVLIDSLCASHSSRLGRSFQISDTVIVPGDGVDNARLKPNIKSSKVISIGVPFVVYSDTFFKSALSDAGVDFNNITDRKTREKLEEILAENGELVTLKDIQSAVKNAGKLIGCAINEIVLGVTD